MPETENKNQVDIGKLEVQVDGIKTDVSQLSGKVEKLSANIVTALTELKVSQARFETTTEKVNSNSREISCIKADQIQPLRDRQEGLIFQARVIKWVSTAFAIGLIYALSDKIIALF